MTVDLAADELELVLNALRDHADRKRAEGLPHLDLDDLMAKLKACEREQHRTAGPG